MPIVALPKTRVIKCFINDNGITDLEWKMIYVGSAESEEFDQVLDTIYVGPIPEGRHMFIFQVNRRSPLQRRAWSLRLNLRLTNAVRLLSGRPSRRQ